MLIVLSPIRLLFTFHCAYLRLVLRRDAIRFGYLLKRLVKSEIVEAVIFDILPCLFRRMDEEHGDRPRDRHLHIVVIVGYRIKLPESTGGVLIVREIIERRDDRKADVIGLIGIEIRL